MDRTKIESLFTLFSGETDINKNAPLIDAAESETQNELKEGASESDVRLDFYAASLANLSYMRILAMKVKPAQTYAGNIAENINSDKQVQYAYNLMCSYRLLCSDLLDDRKFDFILTGENNNDTQNT